LPRALEVLLHLREHDLRRLLRVLGLPIGGPVRAGGGRVRTAGDTDVHSPARGEAGGHTAGRVADDPPEVLEQRLVRPDLRVEVRAVEGRPPGGSVEQLSRLLARRPQIRDHRARRSGGSQIDLHLPRELRDVSR